LRHQTSSDDEKETSRSELTVHLNPKVNAYHFITQILRFLCKSGRFSVQIIECLGGPHGGLRPFHQKSTCLLIVNFRALCGANLVTLPPGTEGGRNPRSPPCRGRALRRREAFRSELTVDYDPFIKSQLVLIMNFRALCGANLVTLPAGIEGGRNHRSPPCGEAFYNLFCESATFAGTCHLS